MSSPQGPAPSLPLRGHCGCGAVRFEIAEPLLGAAYCHCTRCQHRSGTGAQASALIAEGSLRLLSGEDHLGAWNAGSGLEKVFCTTCGSALFAREPGGGTVRFVRLGAIDGDPGVRPSARQFVAYAAPWEKIPDDGLPAFPERIPAGALTS
jgi:hypothetical protein